MEAKPRCEASDSAYKTTDIPLGAKGLLEESPAEMGATQDLLASPSCAPPARGVGCAVQDVAEEGLPGNQSSNREPIAKRAEVLQEQLPASLASSTTSNLTPAPEESTTATLTPVEMSDNLLPTSLEEPIQAMTSELRDENPKPLGSPSPPLEMETLPEDEMELVRFCSSSENCSSPITGSSRASSPLSEPDTHGVAYTYDGPAGHTVLHLQPTPEQWTDFPALLSFARNLHAEVDGCFKIVLPKELREPLPEKDPQNVTANAYRVRQVNHRTIWQVSTVPSEGVFSSAEPDGELSGSVEEKFKKLKTLFNKSKDKQMRNVRYRVDVPAWTAKQRRAAGVPERSPIHPLAGDKLDKTKAIIPGIHTPYVYESAQHFGATFQLHAEDYRLSSLNHLYKGRKIWIVVPATAVDVAEEALSRKGKCSQFMRHRAEFFFPEKLQKMGIPYRIIDQRPGETIVILPDAYHEGFSTGYTLAEAKNYADSDWTADTYQPCELSCQLVTAIPAEFMRPLREGEDRLDLCAGYNEISDDEKVHLQQQQGEISQKEVVSMDLQPNPTLKRPMETSFSEESLAKHPRLD
ncbi:transcription factor jumonji [Trichoderma arundinaceum]|uniref:Transcription factor jumonji n=1 Tax=Trichoderma arundinaceum TaxID=490622 RepID=A0A395NG81_TRIAR|nr:transcription factor jumonji [Trichoderma arundinaceum]